MLAEGVHTLVCLALLCFLVFGATNGPIEYDEAYNSTVSKSLAWGLGYASMYPVPIAFDFQISTGPALLVPIALGIGVLGNSYYVPGAVAAGVNVVLLWTLGCLLLRGAALPAGGHRAITEPSRGLIVLPACLLVFAFGLAGFANVALGESAAVLCTAIGTLLVARVVADGALETRRAFMAGLVLGSSLLFKFLSIMPVAAVLGVVAGLQFSRYGLKGVVAMRSVAVAAALPVVMFVAVRFPFADHQQEAIHFARAGSGIALFKNGILSGVEALGAVFAANSAVFAHWAGGTVGVGLFLAFCVLIVASQAKAWSLGDGPIDRAAGDGLFLALLVAGGLVVVVWWLVFGPWGLIRHLYIGIVLVLLSMALAPFLLSGTSRLLSGVLLGSVALISALTWHDRLSGTPPGFYRAFATQEDVSSVVKTFTSGRLTRDPRVDEQQAALEAVARLRAQHPGVPMLGCGLWANRDLEYLSKDVAVFKNCLREPRAPLSFVVINAHYWFWDEPIRDFVSTCEREPVFRRGVYTILRCPS